jgi:hypothetical protein
LNVCDSLLCLANFWKTWNQLPSTSIKFFSNTINFHKIAKCLIRIGLSLRPKSIPSSECSGCCSEY